MNANQPTISTDALRQAILTVLDYLWHEERNHFLMSPTPDQANHIFQALTVLARWLRETESPGAD